MEWKSVQMRRRDGVGENGQRWDYGYDTLGQVTYAVKRFPDEAAIPGHTFGYNDDGIGDRASATHFAPTYDEDGNLKSDGRWDYLWDVENRLKSLFFESRGPQSTLKGSSDLPV